MKITVHEAAQRTRNEIAFDDVIDLIDDIASDNGFDVDITSNDEIHFMNKAGVRGDAELRVDISDLGFKERSGGKLVADKSAESVLAKLSRKLDDYISDDSTLEKQYINSVKKMAKAYDDKSKAMRKGE